MKLNCFIIAMTIAKQFNEMSITSIIQSVFSMDVCYRSIAGFLAFAAVVAAVTVAANSYLLLFGRKGTQTSRKGQQAKAMRETYRVLAKEKGFEQKQETAAEEEEAEDSTMQILEVSLAYSTILVEEPEFCIAMDISHQVSPRMPR